MVGSTIGRYQVQEILGEGGMGVVYKAEDTKLKRPVALKFLHRAAVQDEESRRRFLQEAQAAAALDHPNICGVFEVAEHDGGWYIAMPFLEGESLEQRIEAGPLPYADILEIARQMADGLEEAHSKDIVHRDIKPANAIVGQKSRGRLQVTLMDFGLARLNTATRLTRDGRQMGTAAYMSPEQVMGAEVDQRTDLWALGVVLYEMTTGQRPFPSDYEQALFYGIQNETPEPMTALRTGVPMELERIVTKCLAKEPNERYQTCTDLLIDLEALARELSAGRTAVSPKSSAPATQAEPSDAASAAPRSQSPLALLIAGAVGGAAVWFFGPGNTGPGAGGPLPDYRFSRVTWDADLNGSPALSPDGTLLAYSSDRAGRGDLDLWVQQVDGGGLIQITDHPADEGNAVFSPDGRQIAFARGSEGIFTIPAIGGDPYLVAAGAGSPRFSPDGTKLSFVRESDGIYYSPVSMGDPVRLLEDFNTANYPLWSPDGEALLVYATSESGEEDWWRAPINGDPPEALGAAESFQTVGVPLDTESWTRTGRTILICSQNDGELYSATLSSDGRSVSAPVRLTAGGSIEFGASMSENGLIAIGDLEQRRDIWALPIDRATGLAASEMERTTSTEASETAGYSTADGTRLVYISNRWGQRDIWTKDLSTGEETHISRDATEQLWPVLSPDGEQIAYLVRNGEEMTIYSRPFVGGAGRTLCEDCGEPRAWTPDGKHLLYIRHPGIHLLEIATKRTSLMVGTEDAPITDAALSADGRWLTFVAGGDRPGIRIAPFSVREIIEPTSSTLLVDTVFARTPVLNSDGTRLYYTSGGDGSRHIWMLALDSSRKATGEPQLVRRFATLRYSLYLMALNDQRLSFGGDRLFFPVSELGGHILLMWPR